MTENTLILINVNIVNDEIIEGQEFFSVIAEPLFNLTSEGGIQTNIVLNDDDSKSMVPCCFSVYLCA